MSLHDISDGGLITSILENAFAGACSVECNFTHDELGVDVLKPSAQILSGCLPKS